MKHRSLKKRLVALAATVLTLVMCMAGTMSASAANVEATGGTTTFNKYLVMDANANVPNVTFTFSIKAGDAKVADGTNPAIYEGIEPTAVQIDDAVFSPTTAEGNVTDTMPGKPDDTSATDYKYATQEVTVDFSGVTFSAPGIYRYIITEETANPTDGITNDATATRTLDVYVEYKNTGTAQDPVYSDTELVIMGYKMYSSVDNSDLESGKSDGFTNEYATSNLTLTKDVTGNQGDRDKYFEFTVTISNAVNGTVYTVDLSGADDNIAENVTNPGSLTVGDNGTVTATYYLKDNQSIVIQGLTTGTQYTISEADYSTDGYTTTNTVSNTDGKTTGVQTMGADNQSVTFTNNKQGTVPTGILLETAPYVILGVVVIVGFVVLFATRRRRSR